MKIVEIVLVIFMAISGTASAYADLCHSSKASCSSSSLKECSDTGSEGQSQDSHESSHEHCKAHCSHQSVYFCSLPTVAFINIESTNNQSYSFLLDQVYLEGLFRPPLA